MRRTAIVLTLLLAVAGNAFAGRVIISNSDKPGLGFNDPTPVEPVGGNLGTTLGAQRLHVFQAAAERWQNLPAVGVCNLAHTRSLRTAGRAP